MKLSVRLIALFLACFMIVPFLFACGGDPDESQNESIPDDDNDASEESEESVNENYHNLPDKKWDGDTFNVLGVENPSHPYFDNFEIIYDEENLGEGVNDAIFKRNSKIETQYDVKITQTLVDTDGVTDALSTTSISGDQLYDLAFQSINRVGSNALEGYFFDLTKIDYIDFTKPYWNPDINEIVSIADKVYFTSSDFSLRDKSRAYILFYNPELSEAHNIPDIIPTVREGKWTVDLMGQYADMADADLTGEGERSIYEDCYGLGTDSGNGFAALLYGMNVLIVGRNESNELTLTLNSEHTVSAIDKLLKFYSNPSVTYQSGAADWSAYSKAWYAGRSLFVTVYPHSLKTSTENCDFDFNVIPLPKFDETQDMYYTMADIWAMLFAIPTSCKDPEFSGFMLEALSAESTDTSLYAYYDVSCKTRYSYNKTNGEMLDLIFQGIRYDPGVIYSIGGLYEVISQTIPNRGQNLFSSLYKRKETSALNKLSEVYDVLSELEY